MDSEKVNDTFDHLFKKESSLYDDVLTGRVWYTRLMNYIFWHTRDHIDSANLVFSMLPNNFNGKMLDVPCGTGVFTKDVYLAHPKAQIECLDYSAEMIERFRKALSKSGSSSSHISFMRGDVGALPYEDESFDLVVSMNGIQCFPEKDRALQEMKRVLKKGGLLIGSAYVKGVYTFSDLLVKIYDAKGIMMPPHESAVEFKLHLQNYFKLNKYQLLGSAAHFSCLKE